MSSTANVGQLTKDAEPIPGYILRERIGAGGYGEVWKATAPGGLTKAIKFVPSRAGDGWAARELRALELVKKLRHPFLLSLERIETIEEQLVIVSELAECSLRERFASYQRRGEAGVPREELLEYLGEAAEALDYLWDSCALQHLDVKPENILLVGKHVKLADFGLVMDLDQSNVADSAGMTPKYASPELFAGRPSRYSDQYSLAVVYCEMATGRAPFSGDTPAVLASQHLHAAPKLDALTPADRVTVEKALAKDPKHRFANCSELVFRLKRRDGRSALIGLDKTPCLSKRPAADSVASPSWTDQSAASRKSVPLPKRHHDNQTIDFAIETARSLPPIEPRGGDAGARPALFVGIGGTGSRVLCRLRELLQEEFGEGDPRPAFQFLFIDTDPRCLEAATNGPSENGVQCERALFAPLRDGRDYRKIPLGESTSISRRWLYNVPRSRRTEGVRAFGRIALLDHAQSLLRTLEAAIAAAGSLEAATLTNQTTGLRICHGEPRVFLVASLGGGTGSGMLLEIAYAVRQVLAKTGFCDEDICGLLAYSAAGTKSPSCLEAASAYACLDELRYFASPEHDYPGEEVCGLFGFREGRAALPHTYLVNMDGDGSDERYQTQIDRMARYLFLSAGSSAAACLDACRLRERQQDGSGLWSMRTLGLALLGCDSSKVPPTWGEELCRRLILRWRGTTAGAARDAACSVEGTPPQPAVLGDAAQRPQRVAPTQGPGSMLDELAVQQGRRLGLDVEQIKAEILSSLRPSLGRSPDEYLAEAVRSAQNECRAGATFGTGQTSAILKTLERLLGVEQDDDHDDGRNSAAGPPSLCGMAAEQARRLADDRQGSMLAGLLELAEK